MVDPHEGRDDRLSVNQLADWNFAPEFCPARRFLRALGLLRCLVWPGLPPAWPQARLLSEGTYRARVGCHHFHGGNTALRRHSPMGECSSCGWLMNSLDADILRFLNQFACRSLAWDGFVATLEYASLLRADDNGISPLISNNNLRTTFSAWYQEWLDDALHTLR
jgi:hypothetical protein